MFETLKRRPLLGLITLALVAAMAFVAVACSGGDDNGDAKTPPSGDGMDYSKMGGNIDIDGSSTVAPITQIAAEEFMGVAKTRVNVGIAGTGGGFEKFCRGETQVSNASRPIKDSEKQACATGGINDIVEMQVAIDALTVVINPQNTWAKCLTVNEITSIFKQGGVRNWKDVRAGFPDQKIILYYPGADSGTFDYFKEVLVSVDKANVPASDGTSSEDDNILVRGVEGDKGAIGYFGLAYYVEAGKALTAVEVDAGKGGGCVAPSAETAQSGKYAPYSRPLFIYTRESFFKSKPEVLGFINFYFENLEDFVTETGYATMSEAQKTAQYAKLKPFLS